MNRNYAPYLRYSDFEDENNLNYYNTDEDFYIIQKDYNSCGLPNKNNNFKRHNSEYEQMIFRDYFDDNNFNNNLAMQKKELSETKRNLNNNSDNIFLNDMNYRKYISNIKVEGNHSKSKRSNKRNNSQNKNISNFETYNIIQIYEAPPLELTPIMEIEKFEEKKKPPKYYRKSTIYSLEEENENEEDNLSKNEIIYSKNKNSSFLRRSKLSNSQINKQILNNSLEKFNDKNSNKGENDSKNYQKYINKGNNIKLEAIINNNNNKPNNSQRNDLKRFIRYDKYNIQKSEDSNDNNMSLKNNKKEILSSTKNEKKSEEVEIKIKENEIKKIKKKNYVSQRRHRFINKLGDSSKVNNQKIETKEKIEEEKNKSSSEINKIENKFFIKSEYKSNQNKINNNNISNINININNKIPEKIIENKNVISNNEYQNKKNLLVDDKNTKKIEKVIINNIAFNNNTGPKRTEINLKDEIQNDKDKEKEMKTKDKIDTKKNYRQPMENENIKNVSNIARYNIEPDKTKLANNNKVLISIKDNKEGSSMKNIKSNKINNNIKNQNIKNNNYSKYICSFSVEKKSPNEIKENNKNLIERKKNELNNNNEQNEKNKEEENIVTDFKYPIKLENNNFLTIDDKKDNKQNNKIKRRKEINIYKINNLGNNEKQNYNHLITVDSTYKKEKEEDNNDINANHKENTPRNSSSKINVNLNQNKKPNNNIINHIKKKTNSIILDVNNVPEVLEGNFLKTLNGTINKNTKKSNHNYVSIKSSNPKKQTIIEIKEKPKELLKLSSKEFPINNKNDSNNSDKNSIIIKVNTSNKIEQEKTEKNSLNEASKENNKKYSNENINNAKNYLTIRVPSAKSINIQTNQKDNKQKKKLTSNQINNHSIKVTYGSTTFKNNADKKEKEKESEIENKEINNNNSNNETNLNIKSKYVNYKSVLNNNSNNNLNKDEKKFINSTIDNNKKELKEIKNKNNHTLYVSINSKK